MAIMRKFKIAEPRVTLLEDVYTGTFYELPAYQEGKEARKIRVGRSPDSDLQIEDRDDHSRLVSRVHCDIYAREGEHFVVDTQSRLGTFLNGERVTGEFRRHHLTGVLILGKYQGEEYEMRVRRAPESVVKRKMEEMGKTPVKVDFCDDSWKEIKFSEDEGILGRLMKGGNE